MDTKGNEISHVLCFDFETTNNEAEYEALLAGLRLARKNGNKNYKVMTYLMGVMNQVNGVYDTKNTIMKKYVMIMNDMPSIFESLIVDQIKRSENRGAVALSKLAATTYSHLSKKVLMEILSSHSIDKTYIHVVSTKEKG